MRNMHDSSFQNAPVQAERQVRAPAQPERNDRRRGSSFQRWYNRKPPRALIRPMANEQLSFLKAPATLPNRAPEGLGYRLAVLTETEEAKLIQRIAEQPFKPFEFQGFLGKRQTVSFGWSYRFDGSGLVPADPIPDWLLPVRERVAGFASLAPEALEQALLIEYGPGAGLGWHRDRPVFGDVVGLSLLAAAPLRFRCREGEKWRRFTLRAEPRSAYLLRGRVRSEWEHSLPPMKTRRYAITFRTLR
jgi:alkylated DNA repair dioxygenase AlkB